MSDIFALESNALPASARIVAVEGVERLSALYHFDLWILVPEADAASVDPDGVLLQPATLRFLRDDGSPRTARSGVWTELELVHEIPHGDSLYRATLAPLAARLTLSRHSRVWVDETVPAILEEVLTTAGLAGRYSLRLDGTYTPRAHTCQYRESDFDFIARLTEREGIYFFVEESDAGDTLVLVDHKDRHEPFGDGVARVLRETLEGDSGVEGFRTFASRSAAATASVKVHDYDPMRPTSDPTHTEAAWALGYGATLRYQEEPAQNPSDARRLATLRAELERASRPRFHGTGRVFDVRAGYTFTLEEHPRAALNQDYLCIEVRHHGRLLAGHEPFARFIPRDRGRVYVADIVALPADVQYRAPLVTPRPTVKGVELGRVEGPLTSDYAQIDAHGRYRVKLLFDERAQRRPGETSTWMRMVQPHAGAPEGWHLPLRKGTEVLVAFVAGDPDRPILAGAAPNAETPPPVTESNHTQNVLHTGGDSRIEIEDTAGSQYVDISTPPERTFIHLGAHHASHQHNYITSTDGNGLIHTGGVMNVTVGGQKNEHVEGTVLEEYDQTQDTDVTAAVTETYHVDQRTTVTLHCQETYNATQTTIVQGHTEEHCTDQETRVTGLLDEHHGTQTVNVDRLLQTRCDTELFDTGQGTHTDGTLTWNIHQGSLIKANTFLMMGPQFNMNTRTVRTITRTVEQKVTVNRNEFMPFKLEMGLVGMKLNGMAQTSLSCKVDALTGQAYEATGAKVEISLVKISMSMYSWEAYLTQREVSGMQLALFGLALFL